MAARRSSPTSRTPLPETARTGMFAISLALKRPPTAAELVQAYYMLAAVGLPFTREERRRMVVRVVAGLREYRRVRKATADQPSRAGRQELLQLILDDGWGD